MQTNKIASGHVLWSSDTTDGLFLKVVSEDYDFFYRQENISHRTHGAHKYAINDKNKITYH